MLKLVIRYAAYLTFAAFVLIFWGWFLLYVVGWMPFGDPACSFDEGGCPKPSLLFRALGVLLFFGSVPLTVLAFVLFRKAVRRLLRIPEPSWHA